MKFRTELQVKSTKNVINHDSKILMIGSCFSNHIYKKLLTNKYHVLNNPTGTIYNPVSIRDCVSFLVNKRKFTRADIFEHTEIYYSHDFHSDFSNADPDKLLTAINSSIQTTSNLLKDASHCFITLGSAFVYELIENRQIVANCHKKTSSLFNHYILDFEACCKAISATIDLIHKVNMNCQVILTISPVRYLSEGFDQNQISKATLITACNHVMKTKSNILYFPANEIMLDDLRDYRFYSDDLIHPNQTAIDYIWEKFQNMFFIKTELNILEQIEKIKRAVEHRPKHPGSLEHKKFIDDILAQIEIIEKDTKLRFKEEKVKLLSY